MNPWRAVTALCVAPVALYCLSSVRMAICAEGPVPTVILVRPTASDEVTTEAMARVRGELKAAGFDVAIFSLSGDNARRELETAGRELNPIAAFAIFVEPSGGGTSVAEIWVSDRIRQKTIIQRAVLYPSDRGRGAEILAVRAVELLKASLADFWIPSGVPPPPPTVTASSAPSGTPASMMPEKEHRARTPFASGLGASVGAGLLESFSGIGASWAPQAGVSYGWRQGFSLRAGFHGLGPAVTLTAAQGSARIDQQLAMFEAVKTWWPLSSLVPFVFAGAGAQHLRITGSGVFPYQGHTEDTWSVLTTIGAGLGVPIIPSFSFFAQARGAAAWPPTKVTIADTEAGKVGTPSLLLDGGLLGVIP